MGQTYCYNCRRSLEGEDKLRVLAGVCRSCFTMLLSTRDGKLSAYLESLDLPAALILEDHSVLSSNTLFRQIAPNLDSARLRVGEVLGCSYSSLLGKCGETVPCILCSLRKSLERTWQTGEGLRGVPLSLPNRAEFRKSCEITTERVGNAVLLLLEAAAPLES